MFNFLKPKSKIFKAPEGERLYAIGDVHGCYSEMRRLLLRIENDHAQRPKMKCTVVFLGDLIDRGPNSKSVLDYLINTPLTFAETFCLMGNHEEMFLKVLKDQTNSVTNWLKYGGASCVESYGLDVEKLRGHSETTIQYMVTKYIPKEHIKFVETFKDYFVFGDYILVHAGVNPKLPIEHQNQHDYRWIREPFLSWNKPLEFKVIHGHTIEEHVNFLKHRIGTDTGAYMSGILSAVRLEGDESGVLNSEEINTE